MFAASNDGGHTIGSNRHPYSSGILFVIFSQPFNNFLVFCQAALPTAFMLGHTHRQSASLSNTQLGSSGEVTLKSQDPIHPGSPTESTTSMSSDDSWKREYEKQVQSWRAQSAEAREKAEKGRVQWEAIRAEEHVDAVRRSAAGLPSQQLDHDPVWEGAGPEKILESSILHTTTSTTSPNLEGRKEFMSGEVHPPEVRVVRLPYTPFINS